MSLFTPVGDREFPVVGFSNPTSEAACGTGAIHSRIPPADNDHIFSYSGSGGVGFEQKSAMPDSGARWVDQVIGL